MDGFLFPNSFAVIHEGFQLEIIPEGCRRFPHLLEEIQEQVLHVATRSRGWNDAHSLEHMRKHFKLGPLYQANSLVLIRRSGNLVGLAGGVNDWRLPEGSIVHLCSLGLMPEAQRRGFLPTLLSIVWDLTLQDPQTYTDFQDGRAFVTAITQSPYLYAMFHRLFELYPSPERLVVPEAIRRIGHAVVNRFDEHLPLDEEQLILKNECNFFYRRTPYSTNRKLNRFCDQSLRYDRGDVFVLVGNVIPERVERLEWDIAKMHPKLFGRLRASLEDHGFGRWQRNINVAQTETHGERPL